MGITAVSKNRYYDVVKMLFPHVTDILNEMREDEKERMQELDINTLGSWENAVVTEAISGKMAHL